MAKSKSILSLQGTLQGITHVDSKTYGKHIRAARGTHKPAGVNETFQQVGKQLITANTPAKLIKDALQPYRHDFYGGQMWQRLVSIFKRQLKAKGQFDYSELTDFEIYKEYPLSRFTQAGLNSQFDEVRSELTVTLSYSLPVFKKNKSLDGYRLQLIGLFPVEQEMLTERVTTDIIPSPKDQGADAMLERVFTLSVPAGATLVLLCLKFEGCEKSEVFNTVPTKGMAILRVEKF